jgi:carbon-monoxide dehydrogenase small subunit
MTEHDIRLTVNGTEHELTVESRRLLVHVLREDLGYTGAKVGCETSQCGACTVHLDGDAVKSCTTLAVQADGATVETVEGLADETGLHPIQRGFREAQGFQCGYCTSGMLLTTADLLAENPDPTREEIRAGIDGNLCRCTGYQPIVDAVERAAEEGATTDGGTGRRDGGDETDTGGSDA